jgi:hypothetical protein
MHHPGIVQIQVSSSSDAVTSSTAVVSTTATPTTPTSTTSSSVSGSHYDIANAMPLVAYYAKDRIDGAPAVDWTKLPVDALLYGVYCLAETLLFVHDSCKRSHGNLCADALFLSPGRSWSWMLGLFFGSQRNPSIAQRQRDVYDFACLVLRSFGHVAVGNSLNSSFFSKCSPDLLDLLEHAVQSTSGKDVEDPSAWLESVMQCRCFQDNLYVYSLCSLRRLQSLDNAAKQEWYAALLDRFLEIPVLLRESHLLSALLVPDVLREKSAASLLDVIFTRGRFLPEDRFLMVMPPLLTSACQSNDRVVVIVMMQRFPLYADLLPVAALPQILQHWTQMVHDSDTSAIEPFMEAWPAVCKWVLTKRLAQKGTFDDCVAVLNNQLLPALHHMAVGARTVSDRCASLDVLLRICGDSEFYLWSAPAVDLVLLDSSILLSAMEHNFFQQRAVRVTVHVLSTIEAMLHCSHSEDGSGYPTVFSYSFLANSMLPLVSPLLGCPHSGIAGASSKCMYGMVKAIAAQRSHGPPSHADIAAIDVGGHFPSSSNQPFLRNSDTFTGVFASVEPTQRSSRRPAERSSGIGNAEGRRQQLPVSDGQSRKDDSELGKRNMVISSASKKANVSSVDIHEPLASVPVQLPQSEFAQPKGGALFHVDVEEEDDNDDTWNDWGGSSNPPPVVDNPSHSSMASSRPAPAAAEAFVEWEDEDTQLRKLRQLSAASKTKGRANDDDFFDFIGGSSKPAAASGSPSLEENPASPEKNASGWDVEVEVEADGWGTEDIQT